MSGSGTTGDSYGRDTTSGGGYGFGASGLGGSGYDDNTRTSGAGPHSSSLANKADPRVVSDRGRYSMELHLSVTNFKVQMVGPAWAAQAPDTKTPPALEA